MSWCLVGSEMCIRDRHIDDKTGIAFEFATYRK
jgi:hypothetical protein